MAKPTRPNNNNYFTKQIQKDGVNFLNTMRDDAIQRDCIRIFRDIARGNINIEQYGDYFLEARLINAAVTAAFSKLVLNSTSKAGVELLLNQPLIDQYPSAPTIANYYARAAEGYNLIYQAMLSIKQTGDLNFLYVLADNLSDYRYDI